MEAAAPYFSALKPRANIKVVETDVVPKTYVAGWFLSASNSGEEAPIGKRIIEVLEDLEQLENRDTRSTFIVYVPVGSAAKGSASVNTGGAGGAPTVGPPERRVWRCVSTANESHCCQSDR